MKNIKKEIAQIQEWDEILKRPLKDAAQLNAVVRDVLDGVRDGGDAAVIEYEEKFDHVSLSELANFLEEYCVADVSGAVIVLPQGYSCHLA